MTPNMRMTEVLSITELSPHMRRITLTGDSLANFPEHKESAHVKAIFPDPKSKTKKPKLGMYFGFKQWMRSYTIRYFDKNSLTLTLDFAVNDHQGLASQWALQAKVGDYLGIAGPGDIKHTNLLTQNHLFFGDITALPAIAATLEKLQSNAIGHAYIQVPTAEDIQDLITPKEVKIHWLITSDKLTSEFLKALETQGRYLKDIAIFIAAETSIVRQLKEHLNDNCEYDKHKLYASAYWNQKR